MIPASLAIPIGTAFSAVLSYFFRVAFFTMLGKIVIFAVINLAAYFLVQSLLPDWFSLQFLYGKLDFIMQYAPVRYVFEQLQVFNGMKIVLVALLTAWVIKKVPTWAFWGPTAKVLT